jgi:hypothetical protein
MSEDTKESQAIVYAFEMLRVFKEAMHKGNSLENSAELAVDHHCERRMIDDEGQPSIRIWHALHALIVYSDDQGLFRSIVFGAPQGGGPLVHRLSNGIRKLCETKDVDFVEQFAEAAREVDEFERGIPLGL